MGTKKNYKFKKLNCSGRRKGYSCYSNKNILKLKKAWNIRHPDFIIKTNEPRKIWNILKDNLSHTCDNEKCWLKALFNKYKIDQDLLNYTFSPNKPKSWEQNPNEWLSSVDIQKVMRQYEAIHPNFKFIGSSPIDFDKIKYDGECVWPELCKFDIDKYIKKNINKIGISLNLDKHTQPGSHWVTLFIDIKNNFIFYFDSNADSAPNEVVNLIDRIIKQCEEIGIKMDILESETVHQYQNNECGIYSLYFCDQLIKNDTNYKKFINQRITDEEMIKYRDKFFN